MFRNLQHEEHCCSWPCSNRESLPSQPWQECSTNFLRWFENCHLFLPFCLTWISLSCLGYPVAFLKLAQLLLRIHKLLSLAYGALLLCGADTGQGMPSAHICTHRLLPGYIHPTPFLLRLEHLSGALLFLLILLFFQQNDTRCPPTDKAPGRQNS